MLCLACCYDNGRRSSQGQRSAVLMLLSPSSCANKRSCEVPVTEWVFGEYPCQEETRYLEVVYTCAPPPPPPLRPDCAS